MVPPLRRRLLSTMIGTISLLSTCSSTVLAQTEGTRRASRSVWASAGLDVAILGAIFTFVVGGLLIALGRSYTERTTKRALREPGWSFLVGLTAFICLVGLLILAALTVIFLIPAFPALLLFIPVSIVGSAIGYLLVGRALTDEWAVALVIATFVGAVAAGVPVLGGLIGFVLGSIGTGAVINEFRDPDSPQNSKLSPKVRRRRKKRSRDRDSPSSVGKDLSPDARRRREEHFSSDRNS